MIFFLFYRINEIINATKTIRTPIINAYLNVSKDKEFARVVKMRIEKTTLGQVMQFVCKFVRLFSNGF